VGDVALITSIEYVAFSIGFLFVSVYILCLVATVIIALKELYDRN